MPLTIFCIQMESQYEKVYPSIRKHKTKRLSQEDSRCMWSGGGLNRISSVFLGGSIVDRKKERDQGGRIPLETRECTRPEQKQAGCAGAVFTEKAGSRRCLSADKP